MSLLAYTGNFSLNTSIGNQSVTGIGFKPEVVIFLPSVGTIDGVSVHFQGGIGAATSSSQRAFASANAEDGQTVTDTDGAISGSMEMYTPGTRTAIFAVDFVSNDADGFTINLSTAPATAYRVGFLALAGDANNVRAGSFSANTVTGNQSVTWIGFRPEAVLFFGSASHSGLALGFAAGGGGAADTQGALAISSYNGLLTSDTGRYQVSTKCYARLTNLGAVDGEASIVSLDAGGFTINWTNALTLPESIGFVAFAGGKYHVGKFTAQTATGNFSVTGVGFQPGAMLLGSVLNTASSVPETALKLCLGVATSSTQRWCVGGVDEDAQTTTNADQFQDDDKILVNYDHTQTILGEIDFVSWDSDGFTLNQTDADTTAIEIVYLAIGSNFDTADNKKLAFMEWDNVWEPALPMAWSGAFTQGEKQQLIWGHPGIDWEAAGGAAGAIGNVFWSWAVRGPARVIC